MKIEKITLKNYRCFEDVEVDFHDKLTVIVGSNGSGKTSILESVTVSLGTMFTGLDYQEIEVKKEDHLHNYCTNMLEYSFGICKQ